MKKIICLILSIMFVLCFYVGCKSSGQLLTKSNLDSISLKDTFINDKPILGNSYQDLIENLGEPKEITYFKVQPPTCIDYHYFAVAVYDDIEVEFDLGYHLNKRIIGESRVIRYDIIGDKYRINGVRVGMTTDDLPDLEIADINYDAIPNAYRILTTYKTDNHYSGYDKMAYIGGIVTEEEYEKYDWSSPTCIGFTVLIKDNTVCRIVFGYPTAD